MNSLSEQKIHISLPYSKHKGKANYEPNSVDENWPRESPNDSGAFKTHPEEVQGSKLRVRPESFADHFSQATMHYHSLEKYEQQHIKDAYSFELSKVKSEDIRRRVVYAVLANIDLDLAEYVAKELGIKTPPKQQDSLHQPVIASSKRLSTSSFPASDIKQRKIALLVHDGVNASSIDDIKIWAEAEKAIVETLAPNAAPVKSSDGNEIPVDGRQNGEPSVTYDAVIVIDGNNLEVFKADGVSKHYVLETYKHLKPIVFLGDKCALIDEFQLTKDAALFSTQNFKEIQDQFKQAIQNHRLWDREKVVAAIPA